MLKYSFQVEVLFKAGTHIPSLYQLDKEEKVKKRLNFEKKQWEELVSKAPDITRDFNSGKVR